MAIIQLEHRVRDFATWQAAFDGDPIQRQASGVREYRITRPIDDPAFVAVDLTFDDVAQAEAFRARLETLWASPQAAAALGGPPRLRIVEIVEARRYEGG